MANLDIPSNMILRGEVYYVRMMIKGRDRWISTNQRTLKAAIKRADEIKVKLRDGTYDGRQLQQEVPTLAEWWEEYYNAYSLRKAAPRVDKVAMQSVLRELGKWPLDRIKPSMVRRFLLKERREHSAMTVNARHSLLHNVFKRAIENGMLVGTNPVTGIDYYPIVVRERVLSEEEQDKLLVALQPTHERWVLLVLSTGLRVSEARHLRPQQVNWQAGVIKVVGKGSKVREVPLLGAAREVLEEEPLSKGMWWPHRAATFNAMLDRASTAAGIERITPHTLRHTFATRYLQGGGDIFILSKILGHSSVTITERVYVHLVREDLVKASQGVALGVPVRKKSAQVLQGNFTRS